MRHKKCNNSLDLIDWQYKSKIELYQITQSKRNILVEDFEQH